MQVNRDVFQSDARHAGTITQPDWFVNGNFLRDEPRKQSGNSGQLEEIFLSLTAGEKLKAIYSVPPCWCSNSTTFLWSAIAASVVSH
jgi:hypothetical protein